MIHHILTTGISLLTNYSKSKASQASLQEAINQHSKVKDHLLKNPTVASAEINSLNARTNFLKSVKSDLGVTLIYTNTKEGKLVASLLKTFLKKQGIAPLYAIPVKGLDKPAKDATPEWAQQNVEMALTRLRESVIEHVSKLRSKAPNLEIEFNCTGGYKAEIAVLYELGRTLRVPVYYLHESFKTCVTLP